MDRRKERGHSLLFRSPETGFKRKFRQHGQHLAKISLSEANYRNASEPKRWEERIRNKIKVIVLCDFEWQAPY